jgi:protein-tyrosine phosphatase/membrane-associated phospholipid phosphatase
MGHLHGVSRAPRPLTAAATSISLSLLFVVVYGTTSWLASMRPDVGIWYFGWERFIPFVPWLIVPYMSIDLFFVVAPFLCTDMSELQALRRRMTLAILVAGAFFVVMPLRFALPRPETSDWTGPIFRFLYGFDRPTNMFPSLHITIRTILADTYSRHSRGVLKTLSNIWFALIGLSTVLTYQHHVIDVAGGFVLALFCYYLIPERTAAQPVAANSRIGIYYAIGAALLAGLGAWFEPWGLLLFWPALSLTIVAGGYFGLHGAITRKEAGRLPISATLLLAPWLIGQRLSLRYYRRQCRPWDEIVSNVWMGRRLNEGEAAVASAQGVTAVLDLAAEFSEAESFLGLEYLDLAVLDLTAPAPEQLRAAVDFITAQREKGVVYIHCKIGYSRSAAVVGAWLLDTGIANTPEEAVARMRAVRPSLVVRHESWQALREFHRAKRSAAL